MKEEVLMTSGAVVAAGAASLCCIGPVLFAAFGLGAFGAATVFEPMRPYLLGGAVLLLAFGFHRAYFRRQSVCAPGEACATKPLDRVGRAGLWIASVAVLAFALAPYYVGHIAAALVRSESPMTTAPAAAPAAEMGFETVTVRVEGMDCTSCEISIKAALERVPGVRSADVSYKRGDVRVEYDKHQTDVNQIRRAIDSTGYKTKWREPAGRD